MPAATTRGPYVGRQAGRSAIAIVPSAGAAEHHDSVDDERVDGQAVDQVEHEGSYEAGDASIVAAANLPAT